MPPPPPPEHTRFKKGQSGNPGGRPKGIEALARQHAPEAIAALVAALKRPKERVPAAIALLDRAYGKPAQAITGPEGGALGLTIQVVTGVVRDEAPAIEGEAEELEEIGVYHIEAPAR